MPTEYVNNEVPEIIAEVTLALKEIDDKEHFVPDYFLYEVSEKFSVSPTFCRRIRDTVQSMRTRKI
jgi:hypothetical protein